MTSQFNLIGGACRLYSMLLYAYPAEFRREYRRPMEQLFRDRCRDVARRPGRLNVLRFAAQVMSDWVRSAIRERTAAVVRTGEPKPRTSSVTEWAGTILVYLFATTTLVQAYVIPTGSMEGNLMVGDHILVDRMVYSDPGPIRRRFLPYRDLERGDIIAFHYPEDTRQTYVKRVIGLPGDRIHMENGQVVRNGRHLIEPYTQHIATYPDANRDNFPREPDSYTTPRGRDMFRHHVWNGELVVPPGMIFAMGDNRNNSADSRTWGFVPRDYVVGKPLLVYWSYDAPTSELAEWNVDHFVDLAQHFFTRTRWNRTLFVPHSQRAQEVGGAQ